jgi:hypothetical protein
MADTWHGRPGAHGRTMNGPGDPLAISPRALSLGRPTLSAVPGDGLLHPLVLAAIGLLLVNDHVLKAAWPGLVTGKLSDFAGLLFFPLFLQAAAEVGGALAGRPLVANQRVLAVAIAATAAAFIAIQLWPVAAEAYAVSLGHLQWLAGLLPSTLAGAPIGSPTRVLVTADPSDLLALPMLLVAYRLGLRRAAGQ